MRWGSYDIENYGKMLTSFYVEPKIKNIRDGSKRDGDEIEKLIINMKKGNAILVTGSAGSGKTCFLKKCFIKGFAKRKQGVIAFWLSASMINEGKPKDHQLFYKSIIRGKYASKHKVIIFIDSVDEIFNHENKKIIDFIDELIRQQVCIVLGCRKNYYNRFLVDYAFENIFEIEAWDEGQISCYVRKYLASREKEYLFDQMIKHNESLKRFMVNPFQITLLMCLIGNEPNNCKTEILNVYTLYQRFYEEWIFKEKKRNSSFIDEKDIIDVHYRIAKEFYKNFNKSVNINSILTRRQKELECHKDESVLSVIKLREQGMVGQYIAEGFLHDSLCEFFIVKNMIESLKCGGIKLFNCFSMTYRHFDLDFIEEGIANLPISEIRIIKENLEKAYISLMPEAFVSKYGNKIGVDRIIRKKGSMKKVVW